jgi:hypothetical protein
MHFVHFGDYVASFDKEFNLFVVAGNVPNCSPQLHIAGNVVPNCHQLIPAEM